MSNTKIKIRGHESFYIREGWLRKGTIAINEDPYILSNLQVAIDKLGVGSAMVKSIRYWLQAAGLTIEKRGDKGKRYQVRTYFVEKGDLKNPEDNLICPFSDLGLIKKVNVRGKEEVIYKIKPDKNKLDRLIVLYVIKDNLGLETSTSIKNLIEDENNIGKVFNLDKNSINSYIDKLEYEGYIRVNRTAGLNTIYLTDLAVNILDKYYSEV